MLVIPVLGTCKQEDKKLQAGLETCGSAVEYELLLQRP